MQAMVRKTAPRDTNTGARAALQAGIDRIQAGIPRGRGWATFPFNTLTLGSTFQPVFSVAEGRCVAYEALLSAHNLADQSIKPETVFALSANHQEELFLDWLARALHLRNFQNLAAPGDLLFLNAYPEAAIEDPHYPDVFRQMMEYHGVAPAQVVVEILETGVSDEAMLTDAVRLYRKLGAKIAIDDFGVGYSNFDRLWRLRPDFVKIDRSVTAAAAAETHARLVLANMVKLVHECGAQVIAEGIETRDEALVALDVGADLLQGFYFARPGMAAMPAALVHNIFAGLSTPDRRRSHSAEGGDLDVYVRAMNLAILDLQRGATFAHATESLRALAQVERVFLASADSDTPAVDRVVLDRIETPANAARTAAIGQLNQVLARALAAPLQVHLTEAGGEVAERASLTLSCAFEHDLRMVVLAADLTDRRAARPAAGEVMHVHL